MSVYDLDFQALQTTLGSWNEPAYRGRQIWEGLYKQLYDSWGDFSNLPTALRGRLAGEFALGVVTPAIRSESADHQTEKIAFILPDGQRIETVLMRYSRRATLCISTQVGCAMGCVFCATGQMGFRRHLATGEIVAQVLYFARRLRDEGRQLTNIVLMGMGEPLHNYNNSMTAIDRLNDDTGFGFGERRFTISTVGLVPLIRRFADERRQINLAVSLHAAEDEERNKMLPINRKYPIHELLEACRYYVDRTGRRLTFEWALIHGVNDTPEVACKLGSLLRGLLCHVNAIPLNPTAGYHGASATRSSALAFRSELERMGIRCTIRMRRGIDIGAGCGQLVV
jgi:23S rRNA (adenine2503-C2)-methyltransferase